MGNALNIIRSVNLALWLQAAGAEDETFQGTASRGFAGGDPGTVGDKVGLCL